ncbi:MAG: ATP-binding protein [Clostridia bacterium]
MGKVIIICGKIGSGKSTYANKLVKELNAVNISQDELMIDLFGVDLYFEQREVYEKYCNKVEQYVKQKSGEAAKAGAIAICENGFWSQNERNELKSFYKNMGVKYELHYIDTPEEQRLNNIKKRNKNITENNLHFFLTDEKDINHYFEIPTDDEIDVKVVF